MKTFNQFINEAKKGRCWTGYKPVPGKEPFSPGSCEKVKEEVELDESKKANTASTRAELSNRTRKPDSQQETERKKKESDSAWERLMAHAEKKKNNEEVELDETAAWQRKEGKSESGGLNQKGVESYRRENPGSKLKTAVTTKPSKLKPGSKAANRRKSFCARMSGMKKRLTSSETANDPDSRINKSLRKWNC